MTLWLVIEDGERDEEVLNLEFPSSLFRENATSCVIYGGASRLVHQTISLFFFGGGGKLSAFWTRITPNAALLHKYPMDY